MQIYFQSLPAGRQAQSEIYKLKFVWKGGMQVGDEGRNPKLEGS
jgi:hypothetical protein